MRDVAMLSHDALGAPGGAGSVENVTGIRRGEPRLDAREPPDRLGIDAVGGVVERDDPAVDQC